MGLEPALVDPALGFGVARVVEHVDQIELLVPRLLELFRRELEAESVDLADLAPTVGGIELINRSTLAREVCPPMAKHVVEVAGDAREQPLRVPVQELERVHGRAVVVEIECDEAN